MMRIVQAWGKQDRGDTEGAAEVMAGALSLAPAGTVELILAMIDAGELPEPSADTMAEWLEICHAARAGEFTVTHHDLTIPPGGDRQAAVVTPPARAPDPPEAEPVNLADEMRAMGLM